MNVEQIYTGCLAQGAYYIVSNGEAAIVDPLRETQPYLDRLKEDGVQLKYIFETHFHADFVSGHVDLAKATGATIVYGPQANCGFGCISAVDGSIFQVGKVQLQVLHTPGHTLESTTFLLKDENGKDYCIFSGDTLFLGDVGRPDLAQMAAQMTKEDLAGLLYDSLMTKIMPLGDDVIVYPAHGAGSACGKNMMKETVDTLGHQKKVNYALNQPDKDSFIAAVTEGLLPPPGYFGANVAMNKAGYESFESVLAQGLRPLSPQQFEVAAENNETIILDTRNAAEFSKGFIPTAINIGLKGDFAPWVGTLLTDVRLNIILVTDYGTEAEAITRLSRVGFDRVIGYLQGGFEAWRTAGKNVDMVESISANQFVKEWKEGKKVVDVRKTSEYLAGHVQDADNLPLAGIYQWIEEVNPKQHFYLHCAGGYRSVAAASILLARGYRNFTEISGGYQAIKDTNNPIVLHNATQPVTYVNA